MRERAAGTSTAVLLVVIGAGILIVVLAVYLVLEARVGQETQEVLPDNGTIPGAGDQPDRRNWRYSGLDWNEPMLFVVDDLLATPTRAFV